MRIWTGRFQIFVLRGAAKIQQTDVQIAFGTGAWTLVGNVASTLAIGPAKLAPSL